MQNVLRNQLLIDQSNALQQRNRGNALNGLLESVEYAANTPRRNALLDAQTTQAQGQAKVARVQGMQAEAQIVAPLLAQVEAAADPAQAYAMAVRQAEASGIDIPDGLEAFDPDNFAILKAAYSLPEQEMTQFERMLGLLGEGDDRMSAIRRHLGLEVDANTAARLNQPGLSVTLPDGTTVTQGGTGKSISAERFKSRERELGKQDVARAEAGRKARNSMGSLQRRDTLLTEKIDSAIKQIEESVLNTGLPGQISRGIGATPAFNLQKTVDTIRANLGFNELNAMREQSPTGGALGNVTEREIEFLQAVQGSLDTAQTQDQLIANLQKIREGIVANANERQAAFERDFGGGAQQSEAPQFEQTREIDGVSYGQRDGKWFVIP